MYTYFYRGYVFTRVCDSVHGRVCGEPPGRPPRQGEPPGPGRPPSPGRTPPDQGEPPRPGRHPPTRQTAPPQDQADPPAKENPPPPEEDCSIRSMSDRYASYWNAFLFFKIDFTLRKSVGH